MPDTIPGTTPVKDQRPQPRGVLPKNAQAGLMVALAIGMLAIIVLTGRSEPPAAPVGGQAAPVAAPDADRLREYQERLRLLTEQARRQSAAPPPNPAPPAVPADAYHAADPLEAEKRRLDYESLFARVVIPAAGAHVTSPRAPIDAQTPAGVAGVEASTHEVPALDAIADAVLRASQRQQPTAAAPVDSGRNQGAEDREGPRRPSTSDSGAPEYVLYEGTLISTSLVNRLDGSGAGPVKCLVNSPVYSRKDRQLLIPPGAIVLGKSTPVQLMGESRIAVSFHRLLMPNDSSYSLDHFTGLNQLGDAGLRDRVNQRYLSTFGAAAAIGLLSGLAQAIGTGGLTGGDRDRTIVITGATGETTQATTRVLDRMLNRPPTVTIREGHRVLVYVTSDLRLPAYPWPATP